VTVSCIGFTFDLETCAEECGSSFCENIFSTPSREEGRHGSCSFSNFGMKYGTKRNVIVPYSRGNELGYEQTVDTRPCRTEDWALQNGTIQMSLLLLKTSQFYHRGNTDCTLPTNIRPPSHMSTQDQKPIQSVSIRLSHLCDIQNAASSRPKPP
jgi:hypothetical protein